MAQPATNIRYHMPVGQALGLGFKAAFKNLIPFTAMALVIYVPWVAALLATPKLDPEQSGSAGFLLLLLMFLLPALLNFIVTGAVTFGVVQHLRGKRAGFGECMARGFTNLPRILGTSLLVGIRVFLFFLLLIVPGYIEICRLSVAVPVAIVERAGPGKAVARSIDLTRGSRGSVFAIIIVIGIVNYVLGIVVPLALKDMGPTAILVGTVAVALWSAVWTACSGAVSYFLLRKGKENLDLEELAQVFA